jgi:perosamine synthetase
MIPHNRPTLGEEERKAAARVLDSHWIAQGREVQAFEDEVCAFLGLPAGHAVAVASGSAALFLALHTLGAAGKRVALPVYACAALTNATHLAGAQNHFIDVASGPNADPKAAQGHADILVAAHIYGQPIRLDGFTGAVVEDCAHALGARVDGRATGLQGEAGIFSFYATKLITSGGQGGMIVSRTRTVADAARDYREFDQRTDRAPRFNFQMTDLEAAIGRVQLAQLPRFIQRRAEIYGRYEAAGLPLVDGSARGSTPVRYRAVLRCARPEAVIAALEAAGLRAIVPVETCELLDEPRRYPVAETLTRTTVSLPVYPSLDDASVTRIIDTVQALGSLESP